MSVRSVCEQSTEDGYFCSSYPSVESLRTRAQKRIPGFAFEYLEGGCFSDMNLRRNSDAFHSLKLRPYYLRDFTTADLSIDLFGSTYHAPFGVSPIGLQGLMWPGATEILSKAAGSHRVPFVLSTVATASIEQVAELTRGDFWFQLYHPAEDSLREKLLRRAQEAECKALVVLADTPTFAYRPREIRNGLSIPPRKSLRNAIQMCSRPGWSIAQLRQGVPTFKTIEPYIPKGLSMGHLAEFMDATFEGRLTIDRLKSLRDSWNGVLIVKGIVSDEDAEKAIQIGVDGIIVSNHGGRQLDVGESSLDSLRRLSMKYGDRLTIMMDSGVRSGSDIAVALAAGANAVFLGRTFMYGVGALGYRGGNHTMNMLTRQLTQVMEQVGCQRVGSLSEHLI